MVVELISTPGFVIIGSHVPAAPLPSYEELAVLVVESRNELTAVRTAFPAVDCGNNSLAGTGTFPVPSRYPSGERPL